MTRQFNVLLFFCFFGTIYGIEMEQPKTLVEVVTTKEEAAKTLGKIQPKEALPMVFFKNLMNEPTEPTDLIKAMSVNGKLIHGTTFWSRLQTPMSNQMFFCPKKNSTENCLVREVFKGTQLLQCEFEMIPKVEYNKNDRCGPNGIGDYYRVIYKICDGEEYSFNSPNEVFFYNICYDDNRQRSLFSVHKIKSPRLLNSTLLFREEEVNYDLRNDLKNSIHKTVDHTRAKHGPGSQPDTTMASYQLQKLVPSEDMALATWRKTTFQWANTALQHEKLFDLWNEISKYIRFEAIKKFEKDGLETSIFTGVFDIDSVPAHDFIDDQLSNFWVKLAYYESSKYSEGIAIIMNNFINAEINTMKPMDEFCDRNLCSSFLKSKFERIGGNVQCCPITRKITKLFGYEDDTEIKMSNITYITTDRDEVYQQSILDEIEIYSIGEIQRNEVLPIILLLVSSNSGKTISALHVPTHMFKIGTVNRRIAANSRFLAVNTTQQIWFCPKQNSNEKCLNPKEFNESEPLQCAEEAIPVVQKLATKQNTRGSNKNITPYEVVYQICPPQEPYSYTNDKIKFYEFHYDESNQKVVFTNHRIISPRLLFSKLLFRERDIDYSMTTDDEIRLSNYEELTRVATKLEDKMSPYKLQKLVPAEDMTFALWRKTTYKYVNAELQHEKLIPLWNEINDHIRYYAFKWCTESKQRDNDKNYDAFSVYTGVFDLRSGIENDTGGQKSNTWVKIVYNNVAEPYQGIAILMNNYLVPQTNQATLANSKKRANSLSEYCKENLCTADLLNKFNSVKGQIRCCRLNSKIIRLFGKLNVNTFLTSVMPIPNVNN